MLSDLEAVLRETGATQKIIVFAHSFGGAVAAEFAARHPERVAKLILVGTASHFELSLLLRLAYRVPTRILQPMMSRFMEYVYAPAFVLKKYYANALEPWNGSVLHQLKVPTLVIRGHRDFVFPQAAYGAVAKMIPNAQEVIIPVSAHLVQLERADATNRAVQRFLGPTATEWRQERDTLNVQLVRARPWLNNYEP